MRRVRTFILATAIAAFASPSMAQQNASGAVQGQRSIGIAAYADGFALVRDVRRAQLEKGGYTIAVDDVPSTVQRDSVTVSAGAAQIRSLRFPLEPVNTATLLQRSLGQKIKWITINPATGEKTVQDADLLNLTGGVTLRLDGLIQTNPPGYPAFEEGRLEGRVDNAISVSLATPGAGVYELDLRYLTGGFGWRADYVGTLSADGTQLVFDGFAAISNQTGVDYTGAVISLIAGEVNRRSAPPPRARLQARAMAVEMADAALVPEQSAVGDLHRYDLPGRVDAPHGEEKKIPLFETREVAVERLYRLSGDARIADSRPGGGVARLRPDVLISLVNSEQDGLGLPLPAGLVRIYAEGGATPVLLGEDRVQHLAVDQKAELVLGKSFDLTAERRQTAFRRIGNRGEFEAGFEIVLNNARPELAKVEIVESLFGEWRILEETLPHQRRDAGHAVWTVEVPDGGEASLSFRYTVRP